MKKFILLCFLLVIGSNVAALNNPDAEAWDTPGAMLRDLRAPVAIFVIILVIGFVISRIGRGGPPSPPSGSKKFSPRL